MTTTTPWAHLPNAKHIDAVLADVKERPEVWKLARGVAQRTAWIGAWDMLPEEVDENMLDSVWNEILHRVYGAQMPELQYATECTIADLVWVVSQALIAWDSSADLLDLPPDALRTLIDLAPEPVNHQAVLLLPWAIVRAAQ